ncbi:hypothetical protein INQ43_10705 [Lysobacter sp. H23M47]|nr:hypothetical protein INQ43_10705 [Lysobacter sp. H23M47]
MSGVLARLGVQPPKTLIQPASDNPSGFWESKEIVAYHERLLASIGSAWSDWSEIDRDWSGAEPASGQTSLSALIDQEFGDASLFFVKDPRMCRLTDVWLRVLTEKEIEAKAIMPIRHPTEVARSLQARNRFDMTRSYLIWLRHVLDAEHGTREIPRVVVQYPKLMASWRVEVERIAGRLSLEWPNPPAQAGPDIDQFLDAELRHHSEGFEPSGHGQLDGWVRQAHELLQQIGQKDEDSAMQRLDDIRSEFNRVTSTFAQAFREAEAVHVDAMAKLRKQLKVKSAASSPAPVEIVAPLEKKLVEMESRMRQDQDAYLARVSELAESMRTSTEQHHAVLATLAGELRAKSEQVQALESQLRTQRDQLVALRRGFEQSTGLYQQESIRRKAINVELEKAVLNQKATIHAHEEKLRDASSETDRFKRQLDELKRTHASSSAMLRQEIARQKRAAENLAHEVDTLRDSKGWKFLGLLRRVVGRGEPQRTQSVLASDAATIRDSGLFDRQWYLDRYPDVVKSGMDPVEHYLRYGAEESRNPSAAFDTGSYLERNPDVWFAGLNPLMHYIDTGIREGGGCASGDVSQKQGTGG